MALLALGCGDPAPDGDSPASTPCPVETCNGRDDDCDGRVDEAFAGGPLCVPVPVEAIASPHAPCAETVTEMKYDERAASLGVDFVAPWYVPPRDGPRDMDLGGGAVVADLTGEGIVDLLFTAPWGANALYLGDGLGGFALAAGSGLEGVTETIGASAADLDGDGLREVLLLTRTAARLFQNLGAGSFAEVGPLFTVPADQRATFASWTDFDGDGWLDVYVGVGPECFWAQFAGCPASDVVLRGVGSMAFEDVTARFGLPEDREGLGMAGAWIDLDGDFDLDFALVNDAGAWHTPNRVFRNPGPGGDAPFAEVSESLGLALGLDGMGISVGQLGPDGATLLVMTDIADVWSAGVDGSGRYEASVLAENPASPLVPGLVPAGWAVEAEDLDLDGAMEPVVAWHWLYPDSWWDGDGQEATLASYADPLRPVVYDGNGAVFTPRDALLADIPDSWAWQTVSAVDLDGNGVLDLVFTGMMGPVSIQMGACIEGRHSLAVKLRQPGSPGNLEALGARVEVTTASGTLRRVIGIGSTGAYSAREPTAHFGLGAATSATLRVVWPDGRETEVGAVEADRTWTITRLAEP